MSTSPENRLHYNGKEEQRREFSDGAGMEWLDYGARMYDSQIGRFFTKDSKAHIYQSQSIYCYAANNPIAIIDENGEGPRPASDPTLERRLRTYVSDKFVDVLKRSNNSSLGDFEDFAKAKKVTPQQYYKALGLAGEAIVCEYLQDLGPIPRDGRNGRPQAQYAPEVISSQEMFIGGWDDDKTIDIMYSVNVGRKEGHVLGVDMPFNNASGTPVNKGRGESFVKATNFVIEVKTGTTISNFNKGFQQALDKSKNVKNSVAVVAMDHSAFMNSLNDKTFVANVLNFVNSGGRLMLIGDLNNKAKDLVNSAVSEARKGRK